MRCSRNCAGLADLAGDADVHTVVVRNGVVLHAPGNLNGGRTDLDNLLPLCVGVTTRSTTRVGS